MVVSKSRLMPSTADAEPSRISSALDTLVSSKRSSAARKSARLSPKVSYMLPRPIPISSKRSCTEVASYPRRQNRSIALVNAFSAPTSLFFATSILLTRPGRGRVSWRRTFDYRPVQRRGENAEEHARPPHRGVAAGLLVGGPAEPHPEERAHLVAQEDEPEQGAEVPGSEHDGDEPGRQRDGREPQDPHRRREREHHQRRGRQRDEQRYHRGSGQVDHREQLPLASPAPADTRPVRP